MDLLIDIKSDCYITLLFCRAGGGWWWVPIVAPCVGAMLGTLMYELMIEVHHPPWQEATEGRTGLELQDLEADCEKPSTKM